MNQAFDKEIFRIDDEGTFRAAALKVFHLQAESVPVYKEYLAALRIDPQKVKVMEEIPFLPVEFFKSHRIIREERSPELIFESSGTTLAVPSRHYVADAALYRESFTRGIQEILRGSGGSVHPCAFALLPGTKRLFAGLHDGHT